MGIIGRGLQAVRGEGVRSTLWRAAHFADGRFNPMRRKPTDLHPSDAIAADWTVPRHFNTVAFPERPYDVAWLISPPSRTSGGHQNAFRFMEFLERAGHRLTIYLYQASSQPAVDIEGIRAMMAASSAYPELRAEIRRYDPTVGIAPGMDVVMSSDWQTAYPAFRYEGAAKRFSFVQDFEPWFYPASSEYVLAENTYRFGFHGFSAGRWLAGKVADDYGMSCDHFDYSVDKQHYSRVNDAPRTEILFYARPPTPRRGWEIGELALTEFHRLRPDVTINLVGWDMAGYTTGFPFVNRSAMDISELNAVYNRCAAGLVLSLTDMSLLPLEIMAAGVVPVVNDSPNTTGVLDTDHIEFVPLAPAAIARRLVEIVERADAVEHSRTIAASITAVDWSDPGQGFVDCFEAAMQRSI